MGSLKESFVWACNEIIARLDEAEAASSTELGHIGRIVEELESISEKLGLPFPPISWERAPHDHPKNTALVTIAFGVHLSDPTGDQSSVHLLYCWDEDRVTGLPFDRHHRIHPSDLSSVRAKIKTTLQRWIRFAGRPDFGKRDEQDSAGPPNCRVPADSTPAKAEVSETATSDFTGGVLQFFGDRVELCGVDICSGPRTQRMRRALEFLRETVRGGSCRGYSCEEFARALGAGIRPNSVPPLIRDLRVRISQALRDQAGIASSLDQIVLSGGPGYRFAESITVQVASQPGITDITDIQGKGDVPDRDVRNGDVAQTGESHRRRVWILHQLATGNRINPIAFFIANWTELMRNGRRVVRGAGNSGNSGHPAGVQLGGQVMLAEAPRYNVAPTQDVLAIRVPEPGAKRQFVQLRWGLIPSWAKDRKTASSAINARADTIATKPAFRAAFKKRRCLVVADGYYEWLREGKLKQPFFYEVDGGKPFALAGVWEWWRPRGSEGEGIESCSLITTDANELQAEIHERMPVILDEADYDTWLDPGQQDRETLERLLVPFPADRMAARPVSQFVNNSRHEGPECIDRPASA